MHGDQKEPSALTTGGVYLAHCILSLVELRCVKKRLCRGSKVLWALGRVRCGRWGANHVELGTAKHVKWSNGNPISIAIKIANLKRDHKACHS